MARPTGFEPVTSAFGGQHSIQLSYGRSIYRLYLSSDRITPGFLPSALRAAYATLRRSNSLPANLSNL